MDARPIRLATRRSPLALWQAHWVADALREHDIASELVLLTSRGDTDQAPIDGTRGVGFFTKRIQQALFDDEGDVAVHSLKDLPTEPEPGLHLAAISPRASVGDCLISRHDGGLDQLPDGAVIGTGSRRRQAQILHRFPRLKVAAIRGNVQSRLQKLADGQYDAIVLAEAGLERLEMTDRVSERLSLDWMLPAPGQGALGIEVRQDDASTTEALAKLNDGTAAAAVTAERALLQTLSGGCLAPIAALAELDRGDAARLRLRASVLSPDGTIRLDAEQIGDAETPHELGQEVAKRLQAQGAQPLIDAAR